jgi:hypothetical protein
MDCNYLDKPKLIKTYTINCPADEFNIINGKCPNYALNWGVKKNLAYWSDGHDFINGKYSLTKEYLYPKNGITVKEYERLYKEKIEYEKNIPNIKKEYFNKRREILREEMNYYLTQ